MPPFCARFVLICANALCFSIILCIWVVPFHEILKLRR
jgi:hypothetical protein